MAFKLSNLRLYLRLLYQFVISVKKPGNAIFLDSDETIAEILNKRKSFIRLGDGEFDILEGKSIHYQIFNDKLKRDLNIIIDTYLTDSYDCNYLLGMPNKYLINYGWSLLSSKSKLISWAHTRYYFQKNFDLNVIYGDSFLFGKGREDVYSVLWKRDKINNIIFVHNDKKYALYFKNKYKINVQFIKVPSRNAYEKIDEIVKNIIDLNYYNEKETQILISAGPAGKVISFMLAEQGAWVIDTGHCWDEPLEE